MRNLPARPCSTAFALVGNAILDKARFAADATFAGACFLRYHSFSGASFLARACFAGTEFSGSPDVSEVSFAQPPEW
jgi:hypothetical protein